MTGVSVSSGATRSITDLFSFLGGRRRDERHDPGDDTGSLSEDPAFPTKALPKFLAYLASRDAPALLDLGPVVGGNVTFFGEHLGCKFRVEDLYSDIERHAKSDTVDALPAFLATRFKQEPESVDGILCWDVFDFLERPAAHALAAALTRMLRPDGVLMGFFSSSEGRDQVYTKFTVVDEAHLRYRHYPASRPRQRSLLNRDIIKLFEGLRVSESYLMKTHIREILLRKPAYRTS
jgi:predicted SAM-dependent methyltransferase